MIDLLVVDTAKLASLEQKKELISLKEVNVSSMKLLVSIYEAVEINTTDDYEKIAINEDLLNVYKFLYINNEITLESIPVRYREYL